MRQVALASAGFFVLLSGSAWAADLAAGPPMTEPGFDWTGYYAGLQAGYGWGRSDIAGTTGAPFGASPDIDGGFVGGHIAGLWQFNQAVIGARAELDYASVGGSARLAPAGTVSTDVKWLGSAGGEAGFALDRWLLYGMAGVALAGTETSQSAPGFDRTRTAAGWMVGAGIDYALTNNVVVGAQYRYYDFGKEHFDAPDGLSDRDQDVKLHTLGVNFSYKF